MSVRNRTLASRQHLKSLHKTDLHPYQAEKVTTRTHLQTKETIMTRITRNYRKILSSKSLPSLFHHYFLEARITTRRKVILMTQQRKLQTMTPRRSKVKVNFTHIPFKT